MAAVTFGHATRVIPLKIRARRVSLMSMHRENLKRRAKNTKPLSCWLIAEFYNNRWPVDILRMTEFQRGINFYMRKHLDKLFGYENTNNIFLQILWNVNYARIFIYFYLKFMRVSFTVKWYMFLKENWPITVIIDIILIPWGFKLTWLIETEIGS